jgi:ABC-type transport system substrate-binding protein
VAESWDASDDAVQWTFKIRQGVEFHNGKTLDAADVAASINHHRGEESKSAAKPIVDPITDIKVDGKDTVVFTLQATPTSPSRSATITWRSCRPRTTASIGSPASARAPSAWRAMSRACAGP